MANFKEQEAAVVYFNVLSYFSSVGLMET